MPIAFNNRTALSILRAIRCGALTVSGVRRYVELPGPSPLTGKRWTRKRLLDELPGNLPAVLTGSTLAVAVPKATRRVQAKGVENTVYEQPLPKEAFVRIGKGPVVSSPELLFFEMREELDVLGLALLGMELCGGYSLPWGSSGEATFNVKSVSTAEKIRKFVGKMPRLPGVGKAQEAAALVRDNCWSPMEAPIVAFAGGGPSGLGYDVGEVVVNRREKARNPDLATKEARVPDIMFAGTPVGINYDGGGHFDIDRVARAALAAAGDAGRANIWEELETTKREVRAKYADDRRRERDLWADGLTVFTATKEDLYEEGALDLLMAQVIEAIRRTTGKDMGSQLEALRDPGLSRRRQELLRSALP